MFSQTRHASDTMVGFSIEFMLLGPLLGLLVARLFGPLTWWRALLGSALGSVAVIVGAMATHHWMVGVPHRLYVEGESGWAFELEWTDYLAAGVAAAIFGLIVGAIVYGLVRLIARIIRGARGHTPTSQLP